MKTLPLYLVIVLAVGAGSKALAACPIQVVGTPGEVGFGTAIAYPGDLNGDGWNDVVVGAASAGPEGAAPTGRVSVYFGGPGFDSTVDAMLTGQAAGDRFGAAVCGAGDANDDGYPDLAVGAPEHDAAGSNAGRVYLYFGGPAFDTTVDWTLDGRTVSENFGAALAGGGDLNGDGRADLAVGAPLSNTGTANSGRVYVYLGATPLHVNPDRTFTGASGERFGAALATATTMGGDAAADLAVSAPEGNGRVLLYWGSPALDTAVDRTLLGPASSKFGTAFALGDVNGDGSPDVICGAPNLQSGAGFAYAFYQGPLGNATADLFISGPGAGSRFGSAVAARADLNGDGAMDFAIGAPASPSQAPVVRVYNGGAGVDGTADRTWTGPSTGSNFGAALAMGADADGDSLGELAAGAPAPSNGFAELRVPACVSVTGPATLILPAGTTTLHLCVVSCAPQVIAVAYTLSDPLGWTAGLAGSATLAPGDSLFLDATITSPAMSCGETNVVTLAIRETACAMPFLIHTVAVSRPAVPVTPVITQCIVPAHIVQVGDSLFTGICFKNPSTEPQAFEYAIHFSPAWCPALQATVVLGPGDSLCAGLSCRVPAGLPCGPAGFAQALVRDACAQTSYDGCSVSFAIRNDVCVGRTCAPDTVVTPGAAILRRFRFGNCGPAAETFAYSVTDARGWATSVAGVVTLQPQENSAWLVVPVLVPSTPVDCLLEDELMLDVRAESCAGDAFTCKSSVFVTEDPLAAPTLLWSTGTRIASLAFPGDLNADGYGDFVVGTLQTDVTDPGRALVYFGGPALDTAPDRTFTGEAQFDGCGAQVTGAGDFNGDGRPDLAVAAYGNDGAGPDFGRVYVFFGGPGFDVTPDRILNGQAAGGGFGTSMAGLGDVNGDGYDDLAVGAPSVATGRVYLYFGGPAADTVPDLVIDGPGNSYSARRIAGGVDLDGDGWKDFCIAAENTSIGQYAASVYRGGPALDAVPDLVLPSAIPALDGGLLCADLNRDGFGDIAYGAPDGGIQVTGGRVSIYFGGPGLDAVPDRVLQPGIPWDYFGLELALAGDLDGDGSMDLAGSTQGSRVWLYHAGANLDESCDAALNAPRHLVGGRDVTGDGHADLLVGDQFNWLRLYTTLDHLPTDAGDPVPQAALPQQTALTSCVERGAAGTRITYDIGPRGAPTRLDIFDVAGRRVRTLVDTYRAAGSYITTWDHRDARGQALVRGVYLVRLHAGDISFASKIAILRP